MVDHLLLLRKMKDKGAKQRKSRKKIDPECDYDIHDSFIDNTEEKDEAVPDDLITEKGGFYINTGFLKFKKHVNIFDEDTEDMMDILDEMEEETESECSYDASLLEIKGDTETEISFSSPKPSHKNDSLESKNNYV